LEAQKQLQERVSVDEKGSTFFALSNNLKNIEQTKQVEQPPTKQQQQPKPDPKPVQQQKEKENFEKSNEELIDELFGSIPVSRPTPQQEKPKRSRYNSNCNNSKKEVLFFN